VQQRIAAVVVGSVLLMGCGAAEPRIIEVYGEPSSRTVEAAINTCDQHPRLLVEESAEEVIVTLLVNDLDFIRGRCSDGAAVMLIDPLGERAVVDGETGEPLSVLPAETSPMSR